MNSSSKSTIILLYVFQILTWFISVSAHSWITCTDYLEKDGEYWDQSKCRAFPRHGHQFTPKTGQFGQDTGYNIINPPTNAPCRTDRDDNGGYNNDHPMAVYYPGQAVVITHPTKNHVADIRCTNKYIPDNGNRIWLGPRNAPADVTLTEFQANEIADLGEAPTGYSVLDEVTTQYPKPGFQNAPKFCENTDKALATNTFTVPADLQTGRYTMVWGWYFNSLTDLYTSCWEVDIVSTQTERDQILSSRGYSTQNPVASSSNDSPVSSTLQPSPTNTPPGGTTRYYTMPGIPGPNPGQCTCQCPESRDTSSSGVPCAHYLPQLHLLVPILSICHILSNYLC